MGCLGGSLAVTLLFSGWAEPSGWREGIQTHGLRGVKNIAGSVLEIPVGFQAYHEKSGLPVLRQLAGMSEGALKGAVRMVSGVWDLTACLLPGPVAGLPLEPETLFE